MRPIFNFHNDDNEPFQPVNQNINRKPRQSLLPTARPSLASRPSFAPRPSLAPKSSLANKPRPSITTTSQPSLNANTRHQQNASKASTTNQPSSSTDKNKFPGNNRAPKFTKNIAKPVIKPMPNAIAKNKKLSTIAEKQVDNEDEIEEETIEIKRPPPTDSMTMQILKESSIEVGERKLQALFDSFNSSSQNLEGLDLHHFSVAELKEVFKLNCVLSNEQSEMAIRRQCVQRARESFIQTLLDYDEYLISKFDQTNTSTQRFNELVEALGALDVSAGSSHAIRISKPILVNKEVQVIPERIFPNSPSINYTASRQRMQLPASPILRTGRRDQRTPSVVGDSTAKENYRPVTDLAGTPRRWLNGNDNDRPFVEPLNFDETDYVKKETNTDATYVVSRSNIPNRRTMGFGRSLSADEIPQPISPVLLTDMRNRRNH